MTQTVCHRACSLGDTKRNHISAEKETAGKAQLGLGRRSIRSTCEPMCSTWIHCSTSCSHPSAKKRREAGET
ncbi:hypothetical protein CLOSTMETH_00294 [[Clostridium] methylpentosum DSM 5476]|uniref:Uncharacterized protein n=1 Tax=[Clostridium] methylpentosum DSM 5476 TaxID=537013 RepID=C0E8Z9_9FIRM|nr:hypothetical protein CLOSTMETH_00294 [[Clostridium] methylpentosum DSM 5476]